MSSTDSATEDNVFIKLNYATVNLKQASRESRCYEQHKQRGSLFHLYNFFSFRDPRLLDSRAVFSFSRSQAHLFVKCRNTTTATLLSQSKTKTRRDRLQLQEEKCKPLIFCQRGHVLFFSEKYKKRMFVCYQIVVFILELRVNPGSF